MPRVVIDLDSSRCSNYCSSIADWLCSFPGCSSCRKGDSGGTFQYYRHSNSGGERGHNVASQQQSVADSVLDIPVQPPPYSPSGSLDQEINFNLATSRQQTVIVAPPQSQPQLQPQPPAETPQQRPGLPNGHVVGVEPGGLQQQQQQEHQQPRENGQVPSADRQSSSTSSGSSSSAAVANRQQQILQQIQQQREQQHQHQHQEEVTEHRNGEEASQSEAQEDFPTPSQNSVVEFKLEDLMLGRTLGRGHFGPVLAAVASKKNGSSEKVEVVAQVLRSGAGELTAAAFSANARAHALAGSAKGGTNVLTLMLTSAGADVGGVLGGVCAGAMAVNVFRACTGGNLKIFLKERAGDLLSLLDSGLLLRFCAEITRGAAALHAVGAVPSDLALRCCQLTGDLTVKVGDFGLAPLTFLDEYVPVNGDPQPVRWTPPEVLEVLDRSKGGRGSDDVDSMASSSVSSSSMGEEEDEGYLRPTEIPWTPQNGVWSLAVTLWEVSNCGTERPFDSISDASFVSIAVSQPLTLTTLLGKIKIQGVEAEAIESVANLCLKVDPNSRPDCSRLEAYLTDLYEAKMEERKIKEKGEKEEKAEEEEEQSDIQEE